MAIPPGECVRSSIIRSHLWRGVVITLSGTRPTSHMPQVPPTSTTTPPPPPPPPPSSLTTPPPLSNLLSPPRCGTNPLGRLFSNRNITFRSVLLPTLESNIARSNIYIWPALLVNWSLIRPQMRGRSQDTRPISPIWSPTHLCIGNWAYPSPITQTFLE